MYSKNNNKTNPNLELRDDLFCQYCGKQCKNLNSLKQHELRCKHNPNRHAVCNNLKNQGWSKGLTAETDERVKHSKTNMLKYYETHHGSMLNKHHSLETRQKLSQAALANGIESRFGAHKSYLYHGIRFISSYEVAVAMSLDENNIKWVKPSRLAYIDLEGKKHHYTADFYLPEYDVYLDPKNDYLINHANPVLKYSDKEKIDWVMQQNNVKIFILDKDTLEWSKIKLVITGGME